MIIGAFKYFVSFLQKQALILVMDSPIRLGPLAPYVFGFGVGKMPRKVKKPKESK